MEFASERCVYREYVELHQAETVGRTMTKELGMTSYLQGLKDIFDTHGITEVYSEYPFSAEQDDGVNLYIDASFDVCNKVTDYIDKHADDDVYVPPELISFALLLNNYARKYTHIIL